MSGHGEFQKRSPSKAHRTLVARFSPTYSYPGQTEDPTPIQPATSSSDPLNPPPGPKTSSSSTKPSSTPVPPSSTTPTSTSTTASSTTSSTTTSSSSSASSTSTSSTSTSSSTSSSSSSTPTLPTPSPTLAATTPQVVPTTSIQTVTSSSPTSPTLSPSSTPTSTSSGSNTTVLVGGIVGGLVGVAVIVVLISWCLRRQRKHDSEFDADAFRRQSVILVDDPPEPPRSYNPRPPTMIERHVNNASPALVAQAGYGGQNFYGAYGLPRAPPEMLPHVGSPPPQMYGQPVMGFAGYHDPSQLLRQPSNPAFLNRQPSVPPYRNSPPIPTDANAQYVDLNRSGGAPIQALQHPMSPRSVDTTPHVPHVADVDAPLPSPFEQAPGAQAPPNSPRSLSPTHAKPSEKGLESGAQAPPNSPSASARASFEQQPAVPPSTPEVATPRAREITTNAQRPTSAYTVYEDGDAYAGI
ncbi:hypothetical protein F5I97DRAFT_1976396 [Phlebopus sp. FC_14]|nr:hypothetical protein F5I97DRAFT_1976396 [Phlebopus sp. FC_14]